ncbi:hypothetical protein [Nostoc sp. UIC 10630]|uniref:hypothetical protein n=1 Tax=Nostoc sp. UIC 10630 TaxID=2100146 RepID=UPI001FB05194|nr:hypothetical protein [Nostoc sp. UIC 10630]
MEVQPREIRNYLTVDGKNIFDEWLDSLRDRKSKAKIRARLDRVKHLQDPLEAASYIEVVLEEGDPKMLGKALKNVIEAQGGIDQFPAQVKQSYEQLDLMLSEQGEIEFYCLRKLLDALGLQLAVTVKSV